MASMSVSYNDRNGGLLTLLAMGALPAGVTERAYQIADTHPAYRQVVKLLSEPDNQDKILALLNKPQPAATVPVSDGVHGSVTIVGGGVLYNGQSCHHVVASRIQEFLRRGLPVEPMARFLERILNNPSQTSANEGYDFLANKNLPITEDGYFLAYKAIREDWLDKYSGTLLNKPGCTVEMPRSRVDDNRRNECSNGLHVGAMDYVTMYGGGNDRVVIVKVDPADIVSVPEDYNCMKMRVSKYFVVEEYKGDLLRPLYKEDASDYDDDDDDDYDDEGWMDESDWDEYEEEASASMESVTRYFVPRQEGVWDMGVAYFETTDDDYGFWVWKSGTRESSAEKYVPYTAQNLPPLAKEVTKAEAEARLDANKGKAQCSGKGCGYHSVRDEHGKFTRKN